MQVTDIMSKPVITASRSTNVRDATKILVDKGIGSIVIAEGTAPIGIVSERDLLSKVLALNKPFDTTRMEEIMGRMLVTIQPDKTTKDAAKVMITRKGRILVMDDSKLLGIVTASDIVRGFSKETDKASLLSQAMTKRVFTLEEDYSVGEAVRVMNDRRIGSVLVTRNGEPFAIFTERDLLTKVLTKDGDMRQSIGRVATTPLIKTGPNIDTREAARVMAENRVKRLPVFEEGKPIGIVTARDIVEAYSLQQYR